MRAVVGDRLHVHGRVVGTPDQTSEIIEVRGQDGRRRPSSAATTGMRRWCFPGRTPRWSTRSAASAGLDQLASVHSELPPQWPYSQGLDHPADE